MELNHSSSASTEDSDTLSVVLQSLEDSKAVDVVSIPMLDTHPLFDHVVVATGTSIRHIGAIVDNALRGIKTARIGVSPRQEGRGNSGWELIDAGEVIVHVLLAENRAFYDIERMLFARTQATSVTDESAITQTSLA